MRSHYDVLGVAPGATQELIRRAFLRQVRALHPDAHPAADPERQAQLSTRMAEVTEAWRTLGDPDLRRDYDLSLNTRPPRSVIDRYSWTDRPAPPEGFDYCPTPSVFGPDGSIVMRYADDVHRALSLRARTPDLSPLRGLAVWKLDASGVPLTDDQLDHLRGQTVLRVVDLSATRVTDTGLAHLITLPRLEEVHLWGSRVGDAGLEHLGMIQSLQVLRLGRTGVTDRGLRHLSGLSQLITLDLRGTRVRGPGLQHLSSLRRLRELDLPIGVRRVWRERLRSHVPEVSFG